MSVEKAIGWTLSRRVTVLVLAVMIVVVGLITARRLPLELFPAGFTQSEVSVDIPVPSANPVEIMDSIVRPTEELLRTIPGIRRLTSSASPNRARLNIEFARDVDLDLATAEVRDRVERARLAWPDEVRRYFISRFNLEEDIPIFEFGITVDKPGAELTFLIEEKIVRPLEAVPGVAHVECWGLLDDQIRIFVDQKRALAAGVNLYELTQALEAGNLDVAGGEIEDGGVRYALKSLGRLQSLDDVRAFPVRPGLLLGQIATVEPTKAVRNRLVLARTKPTLWCSVQKESTANTVETGGRVRELVTGRLAADPRLREMGVSFQFHDWSDSSAVITNALRNLGKTALDGCWLAVLVLLFFVRRVRLTLVIGLAIPMSLLITGIWIAAGGGSLNILSMIGVTVAVGMLIDNAIVVVESIQQHREAGLPAAQAALRGTSEVALAVTLSTMTTVAAFVPIIFLSGGGNLGFFMSAVGLPLCYAVVASLLVALVFVPLGTVVCYGWQRAERKDGLVARLRHSTGIAWLVNAYAASLGVALRHRFVTFVLFLVVIGAASGAAWTALPKVDMTSSDAGRLSIRARLDSNFTLNDAYDAFLEIGGHLDRMAPTFEIKNYWCFFDRSRGSIWVTLTHQDVVKTRATAKRLAKELPSIPGVKLQCAVSSERDEADRLEFDVFGADVERLPDVAEEVADVIEGVPGVLSVTSDLTTGAGEIHVVPDREKMQRLGVVPEALWGTVQYGIRGFPLNDLVSGEREIPLIIQFEGGEDQTLGELRETPLYSTRGARVPMSAVADVTMARGYGQIRREGGRARAQLRVETTEKDVGALATRIRERLDRHALPPGFSYSNNRGAEMDEANRQLMLALALSATFVFLLLGIMFESYVLPMVVFVAVPFSWGGAIIALAAMGSTFDFVGSIAIVLLVGVVVNNGIVYIDCAARLRREGLARAEALVQAGRLRLRPILMTSLTTVLALIPTAVTPAAGSQLSYQSLAIATIGGLALATVVTLYLTPITYALLDDLRVRFGEHVRGLRPAPRPSA